MNHEADDGGGGGGESCPICLNDMSPADTAHPIQCPASCNFNFCIHCLSSLLASSKDDYEIASDGNRHVKIKLNCPNCRADISSTIEDTIILRRKALSADLQKVPDSELSAKDLQLKYWNENDGIVLEEKEKKKNHGSKPLEIDPTLFGGLDFAMSEQEQRYVTELMTSGYPDQLCQAAQILAGIAELLRNGMVPSVKDARHSAANTQPSNSTAATTARTTAALQAANSNSAMRNGYSNAGVQTNRSHVSNFQKQMEEKAREKLRRPLPARMPLSVSLGTGEFEKIALKFRQDAGLEADPTANEQPKSWLRGWLVKESPRGHRL